MELDKAIELIFNQSKDLLETDLLSDSQKETVRNTVSFKDEDIDGRIPLIRPFTHNIRHKVINDLLDKLTILKDKKVMDSIWKSIRVCDLENRMIIIFFINIDEKFRHLDINQINEILLDDGEVMKEEDQDWITKPKRWFEIN